MIGYQKHLHFRHQPQILPIEIHSRANHLFKHLDSQPCVSLNTYVLQRWYQSLVTRTFVEVYQDTFSLDVYCEGDGVLVGVNVSAYQTYFGSGTEHAGCRMIGHQP